ncbi:pantoate--beta-alanine ligase [Falsirhodobacter sp. 20TX0035]|uniref:pantoate--beta-alanine ligase n=1 Tax=Falsirhodobacter sp. 20TX0035 TaxID=3022019 RepID=UPI00232FF53E|nr:pantoate--beta-alanine ligase [Falsirhodobacter sp. 20TX0035]MDB6452465.1 pantoate--beta-alanine ligase [Falsirhodobacter sp. 20TX0035]
MIVRTVAELRAQVAAWKADGAVVGLVPTMGALHDGHLSLVERARAECGRVIVSIFVNPKQFNNPEDLAKYPRDEARDLALLEGVDAVFLPSVEEMYPAGFASTVHVERLGDRLEGTHRPGHFDGMATVVTKLFTMSQADVAFFGEKDWQQLQIVRRFVTDLNLPIRIEGCPTLREADGLAMSSRNRRLGAQARAAAVAMHDALQGAARAVRRGEGADMALRVGVEALHVAGFATVDYLELCDAETLEPVGTLSRPARLLVAASIDGVRLIDNIAV